MKKQITLLLIMMTLFSACGSTYKNREIMDKKEFIQQLFNQLFNEHVDSAVFETMIAKDYLQKVNGKELGYDEFINHILTLRKQIKRFDIHFNTLIEEEGVLFSNHQVDLELKNGNRVITKVLAEFRFKDDKLVYCDELTHLVDGAKEHKDLGSVTTE